MATAFNHEAPETPRVLSADQLPHRYAMIGKGTCMEPLFMDGACLVFDKQAAPEGGDTVIVWFRPERTPEGEPQCMFKRLMGGLPPIAFPFDLSPTSNCEPLVMVEMINPPRRFRIPASHVLAVHKCIGEADTNGDGTARLRPLDKGGDE
jgi:hypothetical protein